MAQDAEHRRRGQSWASAYAAKVSWFRRGRARHRYKLLLGCGVALGLGLTGCLVGPNYERPQVATSDAWSRALTDGFQSGQAHYQSWWTNFNDPSLNALIEQTGAGNLDLKIAAVRIEEAEALRKVARSGLLPEVSGNGTGQYRRFSERTTSLGPGVDPETDFYSVGASASWELDLWGRVRRSMESAQASYEATVEDYRDALVILYAEVALAYFDARSVQQRIVYAEENIALQRETLQLTENLNSAGLVGDLDVNQARLNLSRTESFVPTLRTALAQNLHRLAVLTGKAPHELPPYFETRQPIPVMERDVVVGVPADLLRQRPDVRRAERQLAAQSARIGVATAELYPQFTLPGTLALEAFDPGNLDGRSLTYAFGPSMRWTLFSGGRVRNTIRAEEARTEQAWHAYEQAVLLALEEVENSMVAYAQEKDRLASVREARDAAAKSTSLVKDLYRSGLTHFQNVLDMERSLAAEEDNLAASQGILVGNLVRIYRSLGGGWDWDETAPTLNMAQGQPSTTEPGENQD